MRKNKRFGLTVLSGAELSKFENNTITENEEGAIRVVVASVGELAGSGNVIEGNGPNGANIVRLETSGKLTKDATWPNLSPAIYRVTDAGGTGGGQIRLEGHLTIEAGTSSPAGVAFTCAVARQG